MPRHNEAHATLLECHALLQKRLLLRCSGGCTSALPVKGTGGRKAGHLEGTLLMADLRCLLIGPTIPLATKYISLG